MNCQPRGLVGCSVISGSPPTWSSVARSLIDSYSRGYQRDADAESLALPDPVDQHVVGLGREREDHVPGGGSLNGRGQVVGPAEDRERLVAGRAEARERVVVEVSDRAQAVAWDRSRAA